MRPGFFAVLPLLLAATSCVAQQSDSEKPLPDIPTLMRQVEANQRMAETVERDYIYREQNQLQERDSHDAVKKTESAEVEVFWINGVRVVRVLRKNGKDLSPDELRKENDRIEGVVKKAKDRREKADAAGRETDSHGRDEITVSRILELGAFSNPRRELVRGASHHSRRLHRRPPGQDPHCR